MLKPNNVDEYIATFPPPIHEILSLLRSTIKKAAPEAAEKISYAMPTYYLNGNLVHFAAYKNHIGFYPAPSGIKAFEKELAVYKTSKGAVQFPINKSLPIALITKIVKYRVKENLEVPKTKRGDTKKTSQ